MTLQFLRALTALVRPYWVSDERWSARGLLAIVVAMNLALVYVNVLFSNWNNRFYNALQHLDVRLFTHELVYFCVLAAVFIVLAVYQTYLGQMLQIRWRRWLTDHYLAEWLDDHAYFHLELGRQPVDNPDQRIANDLQLFVDGTLTLGLGLLSSVVTLSSFSAILWKLSGSLDLPVGGAHVAIPGYMLWAALLYALAGTWLTHRIGGPLIGLNFDQQRFEADFRFALVRLRENTEPVALYRGEQTEKAALQGRFGAIVANWWAIMRRQKRLTWFTSGYKQAAVVFPVLAAAPRYFSGAMQLGGLMQTAQAFGQVQSALSWFVAAYATLAQWKATVDRLSGFQAAIVTAKMPGAAAGIMRVSHAADSDLRDVTVSLPDGERLVCNIDVSLRPRALLQRPDWLFLDEATSALDEGSEERLYRLLRERLPNAALVSVGHRSTLAAFHEHRLDLAGGHYPRVPIAVSGQYACDAVAAMK